MTPLRPSATRIRVNTVVSCPRCQVTTILKAGTVGAVPCPNCAAPIDPPQDDHGRPANVRDVTGDRAWKLVSAGLQGMRVTLIVATVLAGFAVAYAVSLEFQMPPPGNRGRAATDRMAIGFLVLSLAFCGLVYFLGLVMCVVAPERRARTLAAGALLCTLANAFLGIVRGSSRDDTWSWSPVPSETMALYVVANLLSVLGGVLFTLFLRRVATNFDDLALARNCRRFVNFQLFFYLAILVLIAVLAIYGAELGFPGREFFVDPYILALAMTLGLLAVSGSATYFVWHLILLSRVRNTVRQAFAARAIWSPGESS